MTGPAPTADGCPRCGATFTCGAAVGASTCACGTVPLDAAALAAIGSRYRGCLCLDCLRAIAAGEPADRPAATSPGD